MRPFAESSARGKQLLRAPHSATCLTQGCKDLLCDWQGEAPGKKPLVSVTGQRGQMVKLSRLPLLPLSVSPAFLSLHLFFWFPFFFLFLASPPLLSLPLCPLTSHPSSCFFCFSLLVQEARKSGQLSVSKLTHWDCSLTRSLPSPGPQVI